MSNTSEAKRQVNMNEAKKELSAQDRYRARVEERSTHALSKNADIQRELDARAGVKKEEDNLNNLSDIDEMSRFKMDSNFRAMANLLDIGPMDIEGAKDNMQFLMDWAFEVSGKKDILDVLGFVKKVRSEYGFKETGLTGLRKLYMYARLDSDEKRIQKEKKLLKVK